MKSHGKSGAMAVILLAVLLAFAACPASAVDHSSGETWTYDVSTSVNVGAFVVDVSGNVTYEFKEERTISVGTLSAREYDVKVIVVNGELSGTMELFGAPFLDASVVIDGFLYETAGGGGIFEEETSMLIDVSFGSGSAWSAQYETQTVLTYNPAYLFGLNPESVEMGAQWSEFVVANSAVTEWENGTAMGTTNRTLGETYVVAVEPAADLTVTPAGAFDAFTITVTHESGDHEIRWWSNDVNGYVLMESYSDSEDLPMETMILTSYERGKSGSMILVAAVGIAVALVAVMVLAIVLLRTGHPKGS